MILRQPAARQVAFVASRRSAIQIGLTNIFSASMPFPNPMLAAPARQPSSILASAGDLGASCTSRALIV